MEVPAPQKICTQFASKIITTNTHTLKCSTFISVDQQDPFIVIFTKMNLEDKNRIEYKKEKKQQILNCFVYCFCVSHG